MSRNYCKDCIYLSKVSKHPFNKEPFKGSVSELFGFVCLLEAFDKISNRNKKVTFFTDDLGECEMFTEYE